MRLRKSSVLLFLLIFSTTSFAQEWETNLEEAKSKAIEGKKIVVIVFQGSDWCTPCMKLERSIWNSEEFQAYAKDHFVMVQLDFPRKKANRLSKEQTKYNESLAEKYNRQGHFPLVVLMDPTTGNVLAETGYKDIGPKEYISHLNSLQK